MTTYTAKTKKIDRLLEVGDVLVASWGYEQTNVDYYLVTKLVGKRSVQLIEIGAKIVDSGDMTGKCVPDLDKKIGEPFTKLVSGYDGLTTKIDCVCFAKRLEYSIEGDKKIFRPSYFSSYH